MSVTLIIIESLYFPLGKRISVIIYKIKSERSILQAVLISKL